MDVNALLQMAADANASDLHLIAGGPPWMRINGKLIPIDCGPITRDEMRSAFEMTTHESRRDAFYSELELDYSYTIPSGVRFRVNASWQKGTICLAFRIILGFAPTIEELGLPMVCKDLVLKHDGLVLLTGPTGCGKSTTLAAMIAYLNKVEKRRVVTIEDPIEYEFPTGESVITQREIGFDTHTFAEGLKRALRQDPDVILVGEMRDLETAAMVLMAAETGHLVLSTGHSSSAPLSIERIIDLFPTNQQLLAQKRLAAVIEGVLCQALLPNVDGEGRVPAIEIMLGNSAVKNLIREGKVYQLPNVICTSQQDGMMSMDEALIGLYNKGLITKKEVFSRCVELEEIMRIIGHAPQYVLDGC